MAMLEGVDLQRGARVIEPTSGNTGISLALICKLRGYRLTCVMPENATEERRRILRLYGAEIVESPGNEGSNGAVRLALEALEKQPAKVPADPATGPSKVRPPLPPRSTP